MTSRQPNSKGETDKKKIACEKYAGYVGMQKVSSVFLLVLHLTNIIYLIYILDISLCHFVDYCKFVAILSLKK